MSISPNNHQAISPQQEPRSRSGRDPLSQIIIQAIRVVENIPSTVFGGIAIALGVGAGLALGAYAGLFTSPTTNLNRAIRAQDSSSASSTPINASAFNTTNETTDTNQTESVASYELTLGSQANLEAILQAAGYLNETTANDTRYVIADLLFSNQACEDAVLSAIFTETEADITQETVETATTATSPSTTIDPIAQQAAENATIWRSRLSNQLQVRLNQEQFETAIGAVLTAIEETNCQVRLTIDPSTLPEVQQAEIAQEVASQTVNEVLAQNDNINCASVIPAKVLTGRDMHGNQVFEAALSACYKPNADSSHQRVRRDLEQTDHTNNNGNTNHTANITDSQMQELKQQIQEIRAENCPANITVIDGAMGGGDQGSAAFNTSLAEIQRLCPNISVTPLSQANTSITSALLGTLGLTQLLETISLQNLTQDVILITGGFNTLLNGLDSTSLIPVIQHLLNQGVQLFSTEPNAWVDTVPGVIADVDIPKALVRSKRALGSAKIATESTFDSSWSLIIVGGALLLIPSIYVIGRKYKNRTQDAQSSTNNQDINASEEQEVLLTQNIDIIKSECEPEENQQVEETNLDEANLLFIDGENEVYYHQAKENETEEEKQKRERQKRYLNQSGSQQSLNETEMKPIISHSPQHGVRIIPSFEPRMMSPASGARPKEKTKDEKGSPSKTDLKTKAKREPKIIFYVPKTSDLVASDVKEDELRDQFDQTLFPRRSSSILSLQAGETTLLMPTASIPEGQIFPSIPVIPAVLPTIVVTPTSSVNSLEAINPVDSHESTQLSESIAATSAQASQSDLAPEQNKADSWENVKKARSLTDIYMAQARAIAKYKQELEDDEEEARNEENKK